MNDKIALNENFPLHFFKGFLSRNVQKVSVDFFPQEDLCCLNTTQQATVGGSEASMSDS